MLLRNTRERFGLIAKTFHWVMVYFILSLLTIGYRMNSMATSPDKIWLVNLHKSFGILVLMLVVARLAWRLINPRPAPVATIKPWEENLSRIVHFLIYIALFAMPLAGWVMTSAADYPAHFFGLFSLPHIVSKNHDVAEIAKGVHNTLAVVLLGLLALHFAGAAAKHHVIDNDDTFRRMTWQRMGRFSGMLLLLVLGAFYLVPVSLFLFGPEDDERPPVVKEAPAQVQGEAVSPAAAPVLPPALAAGTYEAPLWSLQPGSKITFQVTQYGQIFSGEFKTFAANIFFDPAKLDKSHVDVTIDIGSISTGDDNRDNQARGTDWFDVEHWPQAIFVADSFESRGGNQYVAKGLLTLRGIKQAVELPFTLDIADKNAEASGEISLNRLDFGIGQGQWQATNVIANPVKITLDVKAVRQAPE